VVVSLDEWFVAFDPFAPEKDLSLLEEGIRAGHIDAQDEWGSTVLSLCIACQWLEGLRVLLNAGANTELRYHRTGSTALNAAVQDKQEAMFRALLEAGANPDAANYWGKTPRDFAEAYGVAALFSEFPVKPPSLPPPRVQNAEHLADHNYPRFKIPTRGERETLSVGQAVDLHVFGQHEPAVKVRIDQRDGTGAATQYHALLDPPSQECNLPPGTTEVSFGPEHVATVYVVSKS